jgi:hypothetical protein
MFVKYKIDFNMSAIFCVKFNKHLKIMFFTFLKHFNQEKSYLISFGMFHRVYPDVLLEYIVKSSSLRS